MKRVRRAPLLLLPVIWLTAFHQPPLPTLLMSARITMGKPALNKARRRAFSSSMSVSNHPCAPAPTFWDLESAGQNPSGREPRDIMLIWNCATDNRECPPPEQPWPTPTCETGWRPFLVSLDAGQSYCGAHKMAEPFYTSVYTRSEADPCDIPPSVIDS